MFELLVDANAIAHWLGVVLDVDDLQPDPPRTSDVMALRRAIWIAAHQLIAGAPVGRSARRVINRAATRPPLGTELTESGEVVIAPPATVERALSTLARDAIDMFGGPLSRRIRVCAALDCGLLFVDRSRPGTRRWCSMERCGTRNKVRRHRNRSGISAPRPA